MIYKVKDIANKIMSRADKNNHDLSNIKLDRVLYYMQGFHLAIFDTPLFIEDLSSFYCAPILVGMYDECKNYKGSCIKFSSPMQEDFFNKIYDFCFLSSEFNSFVLSYADKLWQSALFSDGRIIEKKVLKNFFRTLIELFFDVEDEQLFNKFFSIEGKSFRTWDEVRKELYRK